MDEIKKGNELSNCILDLYNNVTGNSNASYNDVRRNFQNFKIIKPLKHHILEGDIEEESFSDFLKNFKMENKIEGKAYE
jgi:hypothetical protein